MDYQDLFHWDPWQSVTEIQPFLCRPVIVLYCRTAYILYMFFLQSRLLNFPNYYPRILRTLNCKTTCLPDNSATITYSFPLPCSSTLFLYPFPLPCSPTLYCTSILLLYPTPLPWSSTMCSAPCQLSKTEIATFFIFFIS